MSGIHVLNQRLDLNAQRKQIDKSDNGTLNYFQIIVVKAFCRDFNSGPLCPTIKLFRDNASRLLILSEDASRKPNEGS